MELILVLAILCVIVLLIEGIYLAYLYCSREAKKVYSSVASTFIKDGTDFYLVGSSDFKKSKIGYQKGYQKARFARYNKDGKLLVEEAFLDGYNSIYNDVSKVGKNYVAVGQYEKTKQDNKENTGTGIIVKYNKDGKVFIGWFYDQECKDPVDYDLRIMNDVNLYSKYEELKKRPKINFCEEIDG